MHCRNPDSGTTETPSCAASFQVTRTSVKKLKPGRGELVFVTNTSIVGNISGNLEICRIAKIGKFFYKLKSFRCSGKLPKTWIHSRQPGNFASSLEICQANFTKLIKVLSACCNTVIGRLKLPLHYDWSPKPGRPNSIAQCPPPSHGLTSSRWASGNEATCCNLSRKTACCNISREITCCKNEKTIPQEFCHWCH